MVKDFLGNEIMPGSFIVFSTRRFSSMWCQVAKVLKVHEDKITVRSVRKYYNGQYELLKHAGTIFSVDKVVGIRVASIPDEILDLFEKAGSI